MSPQKTSIEPDPQPTSNPKSKVSWFKMPRKRLLIVVAAVIVAVVLALGCYFHWHKSSKPAPTGPYSHSYSNVEQFTSKFGTSGSNMIFEKPTELRGIQAKGSKQATLLQFATVYPGWTIANISIATVGGSGTLSQSYKDAIAKLITDTSNPVNVGSNNYLHKFVIERINSKYTSNFSSVSQFTNPDINHNAWKVDFTASASGKDGPPPLQGEAVLAIGKSSLYYLMANAVSYNWQNNQAVWQQVLNSIKIDQ